MHLKIICTQIKKIYDKSIDKEYIFLVNQGLTGLLIEDLVKQELSLTFRSMLEERALAAHRWNFLYLGANLKLNSWNLCRCLSINKIISVF